MTTFQCRICQNVISMPPPIVGEGASERYARIGELLGAHFSTHAQAVEGYALRIMHVQTLMLFDQFETTDQQINEDLKKIRTTVEGYMKEPPPAPRILKPVAANS